VNTSYGQISVPVKPNKNNSPAKGSTAKKKPQQGEPMMHAIGKNKKAGGPGRYAKEVIPSVNMDPKETKYDQFQVYKELAVKWGTLDDVIENPANALEVKKQ
jgi:hypothetical protein